MDHQYQYLYQNAWLENKMEKIERMERKIARQMEKIERMKKIEKIEKMERNIEDKIEKKIEEDEEKRKRTNKKISFDSTISAILIPTAKEMDAETRSKLWWNKIDYTGFRFSSKVETDLFLSIHRDLEYKDATRLLYQHSMICYEPYFIQK